MQNTVWAMIRLTSPLCMPSAEKKISVVIATTISGTISGSAISAVTTPRPKRSRPRSSAMRAGGRDHGRGDGGGDGDDEAVEGGAADVVIVGDRARTSRRLKPAQTVTRRLALKA